jgi:hypothetical protein
MAHCGRTYITVLYSSRDIDYTILWTLECVYDVVVGMPILSDKLDRTKVMEGGR